MRKLEEFSQLINGTRAKKTRRKCSDFRCFGWCVQRKGMIQYDSLFCMFAMSRVGFYCSCTNILDQCRRTNLQPQLPNHWSNDMTTIILIIPNSGDTLTSLVFCNPSKGIAFLNDFNWIREHICLIIVCLIVGVQLTKQPAYDVATFSRALLCHLQGHAVSFIALLMG